jgi:hypothetical protein
MKEGFSTKLVDKDKDTGKQTWDVVYAPNVNRIVKDFNRVINDIQKLYTTTGDDGIQSLYKEHRDLRNKTRTFFRKNYPDRYNKLNETMVTSDGGVALQGNSKKVPKGYKLPKNFKSKLIKKIKLFEK